MRTQAILLVWMSSILVSGCGSRQETNAAAKDSSAGVASMDSTAVRQTGYPENVYWGDTHLHTAWSADAGASGTRIGPEDAVRFAMGEAIKSNTGQMAQLHRPLDWFCVTDHSDGMGIISGIIEGNPKLVKDPVVKQWHDDLATGDKLKANAVMMDIIRRQSTKSLPDVVVDTSFSRSVWEQNNAIMDKYNSPGKFTTFIAYEWTSNYHGGNNLHRNVIYRGNAHTANQVLPFTTFSSEDPEDLWKWMEAYEEKTGDKVLAIPHNGNLSNGLMFAETTLSGNPLTKEYAEKRQKWEVLYEVTQCKGTGEAHPSLSPTDEFANFEIWDKGNLNLVPKKPGDIKTEYIREALKSGLQLEQKLGANPFKYGMAGGTDNHTGITSIEEDNWFGKFVLEEPSAERWNENALSFSGRVIKGWQLGASGWTAVWATANTREAIWEGMKRKETYATTGPRMVVRLFAGYDFTSDDLNATDMASRGYKRGVPMGGDLSTAPSGRRPTLMIVALKDPMGANLDRVQVVKGWVDKNGNKQEKIFNVAWGNQDRRTIDAKGEIPPVGNSINKETLQVGTDIGGAELSTVWTDPGFDASLPCFYYVRVLEIPTPRWTAYDQKKYNITMSAEVPMSIQERCYTSPVWYTPNK